MEVAYLHEFSTLNGGENSFLNLLDNLDRERFQPVVLCPEGPLALALRSRGVEHVALNMRAGGRRAEFSALASELAALLRARGTAILHGNSLSCGEYTGLVAEAMERRCVALSHVRDIQKLKKNRVKRLARNDALVPVSHATARHLESQGLTSDLLSVIWNGIPADFGDCDGPPPRDLWPGDDGRAPLVACIGQICLRKAQDLCLEAILPVLRNHRDLHFIIVGERFSQKEESRRFEEQLAGRAQAEGLAGRVHLLGWRRDVPSLLRRVSVLAHAAHQEPLGRVLIEAQISAVPVVCTAVGGSAEIVAQGESGVLVEKGDVDGLSAAIDDLLADPEKRMRMGQAGRTRAIDRFHPERSAERVMALYERLLARAPSRASRV